MFNAIVVAVDGPAISYAPVLENARPVLGGEEMREFGIGAALLVPGGPREWSGTQLGLGHGCGHGLIFSELCDPLKI